MKLLHSVEMFYHFEYSRLFETVTSLELSCLIKFYVFLIDNFFAILLKILAVLKIISKAFR